MTARTMSLRQLREALEAFTNDEAPVMIHPTGNPSDDFVALSHVSTGGFLSEAWSDGHVYLVAVPAVPGLVAEDVPVGEAVAP